MADAQNRGPPSPGLPVVPQEIRLGWIPPRHPPAAGQIRFTVNPRAVWAVPQGSAATLCQHQKTPTMGDQAPSEGTDPSHRGATETRAQPHPGCWGGREGIVSRTKAKRKGSSQGPGLGMEGGPRPAQAPLPGTPRSPTRGWMEPPKPCPSLGGFGRGATAPCAVGTPRGSHSRNPAASTLPPPEGLAQRGQIKGKYFVSRVERPRPILQNRGCTTP